MRTPQLLPVATALLVVVAVPACNRSDVNREAREAAAGMRSAASVAGERLADSWLTTKVQAQFFADEDIKARYITVTTRDGIVTLKGHVESDDVRQQALQITKNTDGVRNISDQLLVGRPATNAFETSAPGAVATTGAAIDATVSNAGGALDDTRVKTMIQAKFFLDSAVKGRDIDVDTKSGVVTLRGRVGSDFERAQALVLARTTEGVQRVEDGLTVDASLTPAAQPIGTSGVLPSATLPDTAIATPTIAADAALEARLKQQLSGIDVTVKDGIVLLQGTVPSQAAKQRALTTARQTEGIVQVVDRLTTKK